MKDKISNLISNLPIPIEIIERRIYVLRGYKVILSNDLSELYHVETRALVQAVKRNIKRFPADFMFQLSASEFANLKSQIVTSSWGGARRTTPYAFTEQGVAMLSSVLHSQRAIAVNIAIMRAFVRLREVMATHKDLARKIEYLEESQKKQKMDIAVIFHIIKKLLREPQQPKHKIGFT